MSSDEEQSVDQHKAKVREIFAAFNANELDRLQTIFHEDYARTAPPGQLSVTGRAAFQTDLQKRHDEFDDAKLLIDDIVAEGNKVAVHFTLTGRHKAPVLGIPATGRRVARATMAIFTFKDGMIYRSQMLADINGLRLQLTGEVEPPHR